MISLDVYKAFNELCLRYEEATIEYNIIHPDYIRSVYFKDQFPDVYQEFMKAFTLVPNEKNMNEIAKYYKLNDGTKCYLRQLLEDNNIETLYYNEEYKTAYKFLVNTLTNIYKNLTSLNNIPELMYVYLKLLTQKLEHVSDADKTYLLNYILNLLSKIPEFNSFGAPNKEELKKYKLILPKNESETNEYYQMLYDILNCNYGGCHLGAFDICPLHLNETKNKAINLNKINIESNQISRGNNKKFLGNNNDLNLSYMLNGLSNEMKELYIKGDANYLREKYIVGDKIDYDYINNEMKKIEDKYSVNNQFNINLMVDKLYNEIIDIYTKIPCNFMDITFINDFDYYTSLFIIDKELDRKYFDGKLSYFAKFIISLNKISMSPNDKICSEYILTNLINKKIKSYDVRKTALYMMFNYMKDQLNKWLEKIKPLLGLNDGWGYDENKDMIRKKVLKHDPQLIEKYDQIMNINYIKLFSLNPLLNNYNRYNIISIFGDILDLYISKYNAATQRIITKKGEVFVVENILTEIRNEDNKEMTYSNNPFINTHGLKTYLLDMIENFNSDDIALAKNSKKIYESSIEMFDKFSTITISLYNLMNKGIENFYNDYSFMNYSMYNNCPECIDNLYKLYTEGFNKIFEEINIIKQYKEMKKIVDTTNESTEENKQEVDSVLVPPDKVFEEIFNIVYKDGKRAAVLKVDIDYNCNSNGEYYYTVDENIVTTIEPGNLSKFLYYDNENKKYRKASNDVKKYDNVPLMVRSIFTFGSIFYDTKVIEKMKFYRKRSLKVKDMAKNKLWINLDISNDEEKNKLTLITDTQEITHKPLYTVFSNTEDKNREVSSYFVVSDWDAQIRLLYTSDLSDSEYIGKYLITKEYNYAYPIESQDKLQQLIFQGNSSKYVICNRAVKLPLEQYYVKSTTSEKYYAKDKTGKKIQLFKNNSIIPNDELENYLISTVKIGNVSSPLFVTHIEGAKFIKENNEVLEEFYYTSFDENPTETISRSTSENDTGYVIFEDITSTPSLNPTTVLLVVTNEEKFRQYITSYIYALEFNIEAVDTNTDRVVIYPKSPGNDFINNSFLILNKPNVFYYLGGNDRIDWGTPLNTNLIIYEWKYRIGNVNLVELNNNIYIKDISSTFDKHLQKEFMVKDFNQLMLRKCFPNNFKRTLMCNQDVLDAIDGGKYSVPNIKIKEALCEYGKYPYYLEHYFMTSRVDYKLKGKFNLRCLAKLNNLPDVIYKYINKDDLDYINNEVMIQGEDMIIKNGKIISSGDVYLVGIELSNDTMFKVPPTKIINKALLNVIDFQQFDNVYSRIELLLDDSGITDYIVKPLALENIGTLKNMKYINFY